MLLNHRDQGVRSGSETETQEVVSSAPSNLSWQHRSKRFLEPRISGTRQDEGTSYFDIQNSQNNGTAEGSTILIETRDPGLQAFALAVAQLQERCRGGIGRGLRRWDRGGHCAKGKSERGDGGTMSTVWVPINEFSFRDVEIWEEQLTWASSQ